MNVGTSENPGAHFPKSKVNLVPVGIEGVDELLYGGVAQGNMLLVQGAPGTGKTTFGLQFIHSGATKFKENGLIISFESDPAKLLRDASSFGWNFEQLEKQKKVRIIYTTPAVLLQELASGDGVLRNEIINLKAKRVLIDGLTPLRIFGEHLNGRPFRDSLTVLLDTLKDHGITAVLTKEVSQTAPDGYASSEIGHEEYVCDTIISLTSVSWHRNVHRFLEISKSRAQAHILGSHSMRIEPEVGIAVYRRSQSQIAASSDIKVTTKKVSTGIDELDEIMGGGIYKGSVTLVSGITGTGKTILSLHSVMGAVKNNEKVLFVSMDEHPNQVVREAKTIGINLRQWLDEGKVLFYYETPLELEIDVHFTKIRRMIEEHNIDRVIIDSLAGYQTANPGETRDFLFALATYFKSRQVTAIMNFETPELLGMSQISEEPKASSLVDNIILLNYVEMSTRLRRALTVPKSRGADNSRRTYEFKIDKHGVHILKEESEEDIIPQKTFSGYQSLLSRAPQRVPYGEDEEVEQAPEKKKRKKKATKAKSKKRNGTK